MANVNEWEIEIAGNLLEICRSVGIVYDWEALSQEMRSPPKLVFKNLKREKPVLFIKSRLTLESNGLSEEGKFISLPTGFICLLV